MVREKTGKETIGRLRRSIDAIDEQILDLINRRLSLAREVGAIKKQKGAQVVDRMRESTLIERLTNLNRGPLSKENLCHIFREIITVSRDIQEPQLSAHLGPGSTNVYAVIGNPVAHSLSPVMHNRAFAHVGYNGVYVAFNVMDVAGAVSGFRALDIKGVSVTIPHKVTIIDLLDEVDEKARAIGAVNTVINREGRLAGYNSDHLGAVTALATATEIEGQTAVIIGAGGAARAIGFGVKQAGGNVFILNRSRDAGEKLAADLNAEFKPLSEARKIPGSILVNTTPVGMFPHVERMPIDSNLLTPDLIVMDCIYNPLETRLLRAAAQAGCKTVSGLTMFVHQGAFQFELWTGEPAPLAVMTDAVRDALASV